jgi:hypothetical protein
MLNASLNKVVIPSSPQNSPPAPYPPHFAISLSYRALFFGRVLCGNCYYSLQRKSLIAEYNNKMELNKTKETRLKVEVEWRNRMNIYSYQGISLLLFKEIKDLFYKHPFVLKLQEYIPASSSSSPSSSPSQPVDPSVSSLPSNFNFLSPDVEIFKEFEEKIKWKCFLFLHTNEISICAFVCFFMLFNLIDCLFDLYSYIFLFLFIYFSLFFSISVIVIHLLLFLNS